MQFEQAGLLARTQFEGGSAVLELNKGAHHDNMECVSCGHIEEFVGPEVEQRQRDIAAARGFELLEHALAVYGVCSKPECQAARHKNGR